MERPALFIDRDGTINEEMGYINHPTRFVLLPGVGQAIRLLNEREILAIVLSNQSGVARGYFPVNLVHEINELMKRRLGERGARIDGIFFCPHHPKGSVEEYALDCDCRKPKTGLIHQACAEFEIDLARSFVVGDRARDIQLAQNAGLKGVMVKTGYGRGEIKYTLPRGGILPDHTGEDLLDAVKYILGGPLAE
jgi:D-glycero-D-manno-heptose 1,7-bisphosphate phosphatase